MPDVCKEHVTKGPVHRALFHLEDVVMTRTGQGPSIDPISAILLIALIPSLGGCATQSTQSPYLSEPTSTVQEITARGATRVQYSAIRAFVQGTTYVSRGGSLALTLANDGSISGSLGGGTLGSSGIWGKWWINGYGHLCMETDSSHSGKYRGCISVYQLGDRVYTAPWDGNHTNPSPNAPAWPVEFRR